MAPEQARGEPLTPRSDVFALGVVLYELITGAHPFGRQVTHEERDSEPMRVIPPRVVKPSIPSGLDAICMRALAHDPRDRYKSMQQLIDAIVEERFTNQYREGASDLAAAIRECSVVSPALAQPRTQVTDRPVTIMTRSLIDLTPPRRPSRPSTPSISQSYSESMSRSVARGTPLPPPLVPTAAQTQPVLTDELMRAAALLEIPPMLRADGTPMPPFRLSAQPVQSEELHSVVGGNTVTGALPNIGGSPVTNTRWTIAVLGLAALIGAIAAVVIQLSPSDSSPPPPSSQPPVVEEQKAPVTQAIAPEPQKEEAPPVEVTAPTPPTVETVAPPQEEVKEAIKEEPSEQKEPVRRPSKRSRIAAPQTSKEPPGRLRVGGTTFAWVTVGNQTRENTERFMLPPGKYTVKVKNSLTGEVKTYQREIRSEQVTQIVPEWEEE
jgi:serine/threonine-protein kinase